MRTLNFANRNFKEIARDPLSVIFTLVLPLFLLFVFSRFNIPNDAYKLENFTPGILLFGISFITLFTATLVAKDRTTQLLTRLYISPMRPIEYIVGYIAAVIPVVFLQNILFFTFGAVLGLKITVRVAAAMAVSLVIAVFFTALGIAIGCVVGEKAASGIGSIAVQLVCFTSGMYFPIEMPGKGWATICDCLPFASSLNIIKAAVNATCEVSYSDIAVFSLYLILTVFITCMLFKRRNKT